MKDWLKFADKKTGLIPRNLYKSANYWNAKDAAADNYAFMVLTAAVTDINMFFGSMQDILDSEIKHTSRLHSLPDTYHFEKQDFVTERIDTGDIVFGASEYIKDGLLPLTEWVGNRNPWTERMLEMLDDIWKIAPVKTPYGNIPSDNVEVNGEMLQVLSRVYYMTGEQKYLEWAIRLGDYYLLGNNHPTSDFEKLRLRDHGCEIVSGLCELYAVVNYARLEKKQAYQEPVHRMLDRILEVGTNEDGMFYNNINPQTGEQIGEGIADTWGYTYNGFYTVYLIDQKEAYRDAVLKILSNLDKYQNYDWEDGSSDGYADAIESALNLYNREPSPEVKQWIDDEIQVMWSMQDSSHRTQSPKWKDSGIIEGWHGDGNFARTSIMYSFWKTQGIGLDPWDESIKYGATFDDDVLKIALSTEESWEGRFIFDQKRHQNYMRLPLDYPRINQFPEWFTVVHNKQYRLTNHQTNEVKTYEGKELIDGLDMAFEKPGNYYFSIKKIN